MNDTRVEVEQPKTFLLKLPGAAQSFRCEACGSNCFHRDRPHDPNHYRCNGCGEGYTVS